MCNSVCTDVFEGSTVRNCVCVHEGVSNSVCVCEGVRVCEDVSA